MAEAKAHEEACQIESGSFRGGYLFLYSNSDF